MQFENSNDPPAKIVGNVGITHYLDPLIVDISREFRDSAHLPSNCKQARNIFAAVALSEEVFVEQYVYPARQKTKQQTKVRTRMAYFFATLRALCGLAAASATSLNDGDCCGGDHQPPRARIVPGGMHMTVSRRKPPLIPDLLEAVLHPLPDDGQCWVESTYIPAVGGRELARASPTW